MHNPRLGERQRFEELIRFSPHYICLLGSPAQPFDPTSLHPMAERLYGPNVAANAVVGNVALDLTTQLPVLFPNRQMAVPTTPLRDTLEPAPKPVLRRLALDDPAPTARFTPEVGESQEVEGLGALLAVRPEPHQPGLGRVQGEAEPREALGQHLQHLAGIGFVAEGQYGIIGKPHRECPSSQPRFDVFLKPLVQHVVEIDVRQQRGNHAPLWAAYLALLPLPGLQYPGLEPLVDQAKDDAVLHSLLQKCSQVLVVDRIEEGLDVQVDDPATSHRRQAVPYRLDRLMCRASRPEAI